MIKNEIIGIEKKTRKPYTKKVKENNIEEKCNEALDFFVGNDLDDGTDPLDGLLSGKKFTWKNNWLVWRTNYNKGGKVMTDKEAFSSGPNASDDYFGKAWKEKEFICRHKKTQKIVFQGTDFYKFCDFLNELKNKGD